MAGGICGDRSELGAEEDWQTLLPDSRLADRRAEGRCVDEVCQSSGWASGGAGSQSSGRVWGGAGSQGGQRCVFL